MNIPRYALLLLVFGSALPSFADTVYLKDGSVLTGQILDDGPRDLVLSHPDFGDLVIPQSRILLRETAAAETWVESFTVTGDGSTIVARRQRPLPPPGERGEVVRLLVPGDVQAIERPTGESLAFDKRRVGDNSLVRLQTTALSATDRWIRLTSLQTTGVIPAAAGPKRLHWTYQFERARSLEVVVKLPDGATVQAVRPEPQRQSGGLIVWQRHLRRQQIFTPEVVFQITTESRP